MLRLEDVPVVNSERWLSLEDLEGEEWKYIENTDNSYLISNYGRVKSASRMRKNNYSMMLVSEKIRKAVIDKKGYCRYPLTVKCKKIGYFSAARLVAKAFIENQDDKPQVDHINTVKSDNRVCNLRWVTNKENAFNPITHKRVHEINSRKGVRNHTEETKRKLSLAKKGDKNPMYGKCGSFHHNSKPIIQLTLDGEFVKEWESAKEAGKVYGMHVSSCARGKRNKCGGYKWKYKYYEKES